MYFSLHISIFHLLLRRLIITEIYIWNRRVARRLSSLASYQHTRILLMSRLASLSLLRCKTKVFLIIRLWWHTLHVEWCMFSQEARFPQLKSLTSEQRTKLKSSFVHFDDPSFCEWMRSLKVVPPEPSWCRAIFVVSFCCIFQSARYSLLILYLVVWGEVCLDDDVSHVPKSFASVPCSTSFCSCPRNIYAIASCNWREK